MAVNLAPGLIACQPMQTKRRHASYPTIPQLAVMSAPRSPTAHYANSDESSSTLSSSVPPVGNVAQHKKSCSKSWGLVRWRLSQGVFGRALPWLTARCQLKLGDLLITMPIVAAFIAGTAHYAQEHAVKTTGWITGFVIVITFFFTVRNNSALIAVTGISFERAMLYHKIFALVAIVLTVLHIHAHFAKHESEEKTKTKYLVSGWIKLGLMGLLTLTSLPFVRRWSYQLFIHTHWISIVGIFIASIFHGTEFIVGFGLKYWIVDTVYRYVVRPKRYKNGRKKDNTLGEGLIAPDQVVALKLSDDMLRIQFPRVRADTSKSFEYKAGQYAFLRVSGLGKTQWHPFMISSAPHEPLVTFHIKVEGDWTKKLMAMVSQAPNGLLTPFGMSVDGPYGYPSIDIYNPETYTHVVLIAGGVGIMPMQSIVNNLHYEHYHQGRTALEKVHLVWAVSDRTVMQSVMSQEIIATKVHATLEQDVVASYIPDSLLSDDGSLDKVFRTKIFLMEGERDLENPIDQLLQRHMRYNERPDFASALNCMGELARSAGKARVAVLVCGSSELIADVTAQSLALSSVMKLHFDVHSDYFEF